MRLRRLQVERFRGIRSLDWIVGGPFACLVGAGDSCKTTILDALELVLSPRWNIPFDDFDFFDADTAKPLVITATISDVPLELRRDDKFGLHMQGWCKSELVPEPEDGSEPVLVIELRVQGDLEPQWSVIDGKGIATRVSGRDREALTVARVGTLIDRHLSWARGSVLSRLTGDYGELSSVVAEATRAARRSVTSSPMPKLEAAALRAEELGREIGVAFSSSVAPRVEAATISFSLHHGNVPLRRAGMGTRRLLISAMQRGLAAGQGALVIDELEQGLEPHRILWAVRLLRQDSKRPGIGQVVATSHSPVVVGDLGASELAVVRRASDGAVTVLAMPSEFGPLARRQPEALLARKIVVAEGETEVGFIRGLDAVWHGETTESFAFRGVAVVDAGGGSAPSDRALKFRSLGYEVALVVDGDRQLRHPRTHYESENIVLVQWADEMALEERIAADLPWPALNRVVSIAISHVGFERVAASFASELGCGRAGVPRDPEAWASLGHVEDKLRRAIGRAAKHADWIKRADVAEAVGAEVGRVLSEIPATDLSIKITGLRRFVHG